MSGNMLHTLCLSFILLVSACKGSLPQWPNQAITNWTIYNAPPSPLPPLYNEGIPPPPYSAGRGYTYYDWSLKAMREVYLDFCVPIFPSGNNWKPQGQPPCCVFADPWSPPAPNFLEISNATANGTGTVWGEPVEWFVIDVGPEYGGPFGYSYYTGPGGALQPGSFYFGGVTGWVLQAYWNFTGATPDPSVWAIPDHCLSASNCI